MNMNMNININMNMNMNANGGYDNSYDLLDTIKEERYNDANGNYYLRLLRQCQSFQEGYHWLVKYQKEIFAIQDVQYHKILLQHYIHMAQIDPNLHWNLMYDLLQQYWMGLLHIQQQQQQQQSQLQSSQPSQSQYPLNISFHFARSFIQYMCNNFLNILAKRGDYQQLSIFTQKLLNVTNNINNTTSTSTSTDHNIENESNRNRIYNIMEKNSHQLYTYLIQAFRIANQEKKGWFLFQQLLRELNVVPNVQILTQAYLCNTKELDNYLRFLQGYNVTPTVESLLEVMNFHIKEIKYKLMPQFETVLANSDNKLTPDYINKKRKIEKKGSTMMDSNTIDISQLRGDVLSQINHILYMCNEMIDRYHLYLPHYHQMAKEERLYTDTIFNFSKGKYDIFYALIDILLNNIYRHYDKLELASHKIINTKRLQAPCPWIHQIILDDILSHLLIKHHIELDTHYLQLIFHGCLDCNDVMLAQEVRQHCKKNDIWIDQTCQSLYERLLLRVKKRSGKEVQDIKMIDTKAVPPQSLAHVSIDELYNEQSQPLGFPGDIILQSNSTKTSSTTQTQVDPSCYALAKSLLSKAELIRQRYEKNINWKAFADRYLIDLSNAVDLCREYNDITSTRLLYHSFLRSQLTLRKFPELAKNFLYLLHNNDHNKEKLYIKDQNQYRITSEEVLTLWSDYPLQGFMNKAFQIFLEMQDCDSIHYWWISVAAANNNSNNDKDSSIHKRKIFVTPFYYYATCKLYLQHITKLLDAIDNDIEINYGRYKIPYRVLLLKTLLEIKRNNTSHNNKSKNTTNELIGWNEFYERRQIYKLWRQLWELMNVYPTDNKYTNVRGYRDPKNISYVTNEMLNLLLNETIMCQKKIKSMNRRNVVRLKQDWWEDIMMENVKQLYYITQKFDIQLSISSIKQLHHTLKNESHQSWLRNSFGI